MSIKEIIYDFCSYYNFGAPIAEDFFTFYPIYSKHQETSILGLIEAEESDIAWIQESENAESVEMLEAINTGKIPVLIPYLHQVQGGKQDRTIFEPIIIPIGRQKRNPLKVTARCIEQSRWRYSSSRGESTSARFYSAKSRMAPQMANVSSKAKDQSTVWSSIGAAASMMGVMHDEAPTSSYREIQEKTYEKDSKLGELLQKVISQVQLKDQVGLICFYKGKLVGIESFSSSKLWNQFTEVVVKGFLTDQAFLKDEKTSPLPENLSAYLKEDLKEVKITPEEATGLGRLERFSDENWEGISIIHEGVPIHLHASKRIKDILKGQITRNIRQETFQAFPNLGEEISSQVTPEDIVQEQIQFRREDRQ